MQQASLCSRKGACCCNVLACQLYLSLHNLLVVQHCCAACWLTLCICYTGLPVRVWVVTIFVLGSLVDLTHLRFDSRCNIHTGRSELCTAPCSLHRSYTVTTTAHHPPATHTARNVPACCALLGSQAMLDLVEHNKEEQPPNEPLTPTLKLHRT